MESPDHIEESKKNSLITVFPQGDNAKPKDDNSLLRTSSCDCTCRRSAARKEIAMKGKGKDEEEDSYKQLLKKEYEEKLEKEINTLTDKFDYILSNEQVRTSYMLTEAHRERTELVKAIQALMECKNITGMMYVMCSERRRAKLDKLRVVEEYTNHIEHILQLLKEAQQVILNLSRGYKTAARVDQEWRNKMELVIHEFQTFVNNFVGGVPEHNQFFFNLPKLLETEAPLVDNPNEDPISSINEMSEPQAEKHWWEELGNECPPFIVYGDMSEFKAPERRKVLKDVKAAKTAPRKWKEYVFEDMRLEARCMNADEIKDLFNQHDSLPRESIYGGSVGPALSRRMTVASIENIGMGSILKFMSGAEPVTKTTLLGAKDSIEVVAEKIHHKSHHGITKTAEPERKGSDTSSVKINAKMRRTSFAEKSAFYEFEPDPEPTDTTESAEVQPIYAQQESTLKEESSQEAVVEEEILTSVSRQHTDSLELVPPKTMVEENDRLNDDKYCPAKNCKMMQMDPFLRSLPPYMNASPFTHFESTYENYEACTPEQLEILRKRVEEKKKGKKIEYEHLLAENPAKDWDESASDGGVGVQTSSLSVTDLLPCTCKAPPISEVSSDRKIYSLADLLPTKILLNEITEKFFFDEDIEFKRFKVLGQKTHGSDSSSRSSASTAWDPYGTVKKLEDIRSVLKKHDSLAALFQHM